MKCSEIRIDLMELIDDIVNNHKERQWVNKKWLRI
jgi:hypothetical protein